MPEAASIGDTDLMTASSGLQVELHHLGVQTTDLDNAVEWYRDFLGCELAWTLETFSDLTRSRLPGITRLVEVARGDLRFHLFEQESAAAPAPAGAAGVQHVCLRCRDRGDMVAWNEHWCELYSSGRFHFVYDEQPTEIVEDPDGVLSFYCLDPNGLEFEFTWVPEETAR